mgnify:CR=1 FL=1
MNKDAVLIEDLPNNLSFSDLVWKEDSNAGSGKEGRMIYSFKNDDTEYLPLFKVKESGGFVIPISGKGLWSTIKGFIYVVPNEDRNMKEWDYSVQGISFYEHGETPGLGGEIGPNSNYSGLPNQSKWLLSVGMILGRLEIFAILIIFLPSFWRK